MTPTNPTINLRTTNADGTTETITMHPSNPIYPIFAAHLAALTDTIPEATATLTTGGQPHPSTGRLEGPIPRALGTTLLVEYAHNDARGFTDNVPGMEHYELDGEHMFTEWRALSYASLPELTRAVFVALPPEDQQKVRDLAHKGFIVALTEHADALPAALKSKTLHTLPGLAVAMQFADTVLGTDEMVRIAMEHGYPGTANDGGKVH